MPQVEDLFYWKAWSELHASRPVGMGACPIPFSEIVSWLDIRCIYDPQERMDLMSIVKTLDDKWLSWARNKSGNSTQETD